MTEHEVTLAKFSELFTGVSSPVKPVAMSAHPLYYAWTNTLKGIYYGPGSLKSALPQLLGTLKASRALVVTGKTLYEKVTFSADVCDQSN